MTTVYVAKCTTDAPDALDVVYGPRYVEILGVFSKKELAEQSFTRKEKHTDKKGSWVEEHICFEGEHEVFEYEIDA